MRFRAFLVIAAASLGAAAARKSGAPVRDLRRPASAAAVTAAGAPQCATGSACHMLYYGGKVIPNAKVYVVHWTSAVAPGGDLGAFYDAITNSTYLDWLNEYDTDITPTGTGGSATGTHQLIGRGVYGGTFTIAPSAANAGGPCPATTPAGTDTCLTDAQVQNELNAQLAAGHLPPSDENALYMTYFPPHTFIASAGTGSCISSGFCGYHGTFKNATREFYYGVLPDHGPGSGCDTGCGSGSSNFDNLTSTSAHELCEAITDAEVGIVPNTSNLGLGWYDNQNGEIGDLCGSTSQVTGFTVQNIFSNLVAAGSPTASCVSSRTATDDFSVSLAANRTKVAGGTSITVPITTAVTSGSPGTLTLSFSGLPAHVSGSLDQPTVQAGSGALLTLTADSSTPSAANVVVQVKAVAGITVHTAGLLLDVAPGTSANDFSLSISPPANTTIAAGSSGVYTVNTAAIGSFATPIALSVGALPAGVTFSFSPATVTPGQPGTLTLSVATGTATTPGTTFTVTGTAGAASHGTTSIVGVGSAAVPGNFSIVLTPPADTHIAPGGSADWAIDTAFVSGSAEQIALTVGALPAGVHASLLTATVTAGTGTTLTLTAASNAPPASAATFTVQGIDDAFVVHTATSQVSVTPVTNDFALAPASATVAPGHFVQVQVATSLVSGAAESIALVASGLPSGVTAAFAPAAVTAGGSAILTLSATPAAAPVTSAPFTVTGTAASASHGTAFALTVSGTSGTPTVAITHPDASATVSGAVEIDATAAPGPGAALVKVELLVDGVVAATLPGSPAQGFWQSTESVEGPHTLTARAVDSNGGSTRSAPVGVTVHNPGGGTTASGSGGCASGGASLSALLGLLVTLRRRRVT